MIGSLQVKILSMRSSELNMAFVRIFHTTWRSTLSLSLFWTAFRGSEEDVALAHLAHEIRVGLVQGGSGGPLRVLVCRFLGGERVVGVGCHGTTDGKYDVVHTALTGC